MCGGTHGVMQIVDGLERSRLTHWQSKRLAVIWVGLGLVLAGCPRPPGGTVSPAATSQATVVSAPAPTARPPSPGTAAAPDVIIGTPRANGPLTKEAIYQVVHGSYRAELVRCYHETLAKKPSVQGRIMLSLAIDKSGAVSESSIESDSAQEDELERCFAAVGKQMRFPPSTSLTVAGIPTVFVIEP